MDDWFRNDAGCREYLRRPGWLYGFTCSRRGVTWETWMMSDGLPRCRSRHGRTSLTADTVLPDKRKPLRV